MSIQLTKQKAIEEHRKMWNWIADELEKGACTGKCSVTILKDKYCDMNGMSPTNECFCCAYDEQFRINHRNCEYCPIIWDSEYQDYMCEDIDVDTAGLWIQANCLSHRGEYTKAGLIARQIANLPERPNKQGDIL